MSYETDFESELGNAYQAFAGAMARGGARAKGGSATGHNFWDVVMRFSHAELEDMIIYLEKNAKSMSHSELVQYHLRIVSYFDRIEHLGTPGTERFDTGELEKLIELYHREGQQNDIARQVISERRQLQNLQVVQTKLAEYFQILYDYLYTDPRSLVNPKQREELLNDTTLKMKAYKLFLRETRSPLSVLDGEDVTAGIQSLALNSSSEKLSKDNAASRVQLPELKPPSYRISKEDLSAAKLQDNIVAYILCGYFRYHIKKQEVNVIESIMDLESQLREVKLEPQETNQLRTFEKGGDRVYSPSNYYAAYTNAVWAQVVHVFRELHKSGIEIKVNVNI